MFNFILKDTNDDEFVKIHIDDLFVEQSAFLTTMKEDFGENNEMDVPIPEEVADVDRMKRFLAIVENPNVDIHRPTAMDTIEEIVSYLELSQFLQMDRIKKHLFRRLKSLLSHLNHYELANVFAQKGDKKNQIDPPFISNLDEMISILKRFSQSSS